MAQTVSDTLPIDAGSQKFAGAVDPDVGTFVLPVAIGDFSSGGKTYGFLGVLLGYRSNTVFSAVGLTTTIDKNGETGSATSGLDCRGFNRVGIFASVSAMAGGCSLVTITLHRRKTQTGSDFNPAVAVGGIASNQDLFLGAVELDAPYVMIGAVCDVGTATLTLEAYLFRE